MQIRLFIATLMLLLTMAGNAQVFQTNNTPMNFARGLKARDLLIAPKGCDTTALSNPKWGESTAGALFVDTCNNRLYFFNGVKWNQVTGGGGGVDSFYYNFRSLNDTTLLWDRGDGVVDTLAFSSGTSLIGAYIDDIKAIGQDLYYYKNGDSTFIVNIAQGSTGGDTTIFSFVVDTTNVARFQIPYADTTGYFKGDTALTWQPSDKTLVTDNLYMYGTDASRAAKMWFKIPYPTFGYRPRIYAGMLPTDVANGAIYFSGGGSNALMEINSGDNNQLLLHSPDGEMLFKQTDGLYRFYNVPNETSYNKMLVINDSGFVAWKAPADISGKLNISDTANMLRNAVRSIYRKAGSDSVFAVSGAGTAFAFRDSTGGGGGVTTVGTFSGSSQPNGASISGSTITFGPADATNPGMVSTGTQTWAGTKTFNGTIIPNLIDFSNGSAGDRILLNATGERFGLGLSSLGAVLFGSTGQGVSIFAGNYASVPNSGTPLIRILPATTTISNDLNITGSLNFFNSSTNAYGVRQYYNASGQRWGFGGSNASGAGSMTSLQWFNPSFAFWTFNGGGTLNLEGSNEWLRIASGGIGINTGSANNASAQLQINSTTKGFLPPRMTTTQQNAISTPADGLQIYNSTLSQPHYRDGSTWQAQVGMTFGTAAPTSTPTAVGNFFLDTTNKKLYVATGTASSADWNILN